MPLVAESPKEDVIAAFAAHVSSGKAKFFAQAGIDFVLGKREGVYVWDRSGQKLIDCHCNGGVFNLGHRHPRIVAALRQALDEFDIGNHHLMSEPRARLAERLVSLCPGDLDRVVFGVGGGEAVDLAIKLARGHTGRTNVISAHGGYHGHTGLALAAGDEQYRRPFGPAAPGFVQVPFGDLEALGAAMDEETAAVIFETIPATLGIVPPPEPFYAGVRRLCDERGALMIMDEVQSGLGRCGAIWAIDSYGVSPDILVTAKGLSGGIYPISATIYREGLNPVFDANPFIHISTFGGAEVGCLVALEVLNLLEEPGFLEHVRAMADKFSEGVEQLKSHHPRVLVGLNQKGLMMGLKLADPALGPLLTLSGFRYGLLTVYANHDPSVGQLLPPLIIREPEVQQVIDILDHMLTWVEGVIQASGPGMPAGLK